MSQTYSHNNNGHKRKLGGLSGIAPLKTLEALKVFANLTP